MGISPSVVVSETGIKPCHLIEGQDRRVMIHTPRIPTEHGNITVNTLHQERLTADSFMADGFIPDADGFKRKECPSCEICIPVRINLHDFNEAAGQNAKLRNERKKLRDINGDMRSIVQAGLPPIATEFESVKYAHKHADLYQRYTAVRFPLKREFNAVAELEGMARYRGFRPHHLDVVSAGNRLAGTTIFHIAERSAYGTVFFYEPALLKDGIGHYMMLETIRTLQQRDIDYLYLASWSSRPSPLSWKSKLTPLEMLIDGEWVRFNHNDMRAMRDRDHPAYPASRRPELKAQP